MLWQKYMHRKRKRNREEKRSKSNLISDFHHPYALQGLYNIFWVQVLTSPDRTWISLEIEVFPHVN
jgi:hypothetical protein